jgi:hypothetical protein
MIINTSHAVRDRLRCFSWSIFDLPLRLVCDAWQERYIVYTQLSILFGKWETLFVGLKRVLKKVGAVRTIKRPGAKARRLSCPYS